MSQLLQLGLSPPDRRNNPLENPSVPLSSSAAWALISGADDPPAGPITPASAMQLGAVNACVNLIADSISSLGLLLYRRVGAGKEEAHDNPLHYLLSLEPNIDSSSITLWHGFISSMLLHGNGFCEVTRNNGRVTGLWLLDPRQISVGRLNDGNLIYTTTENGIARSLSASNVIHCPMYTAPDGVMGLSVLHSARNLMASSISLDKFSGRFFANNATPSGILTTSQKYAQKIRPR